MGIYISSICLMLFAITFFIRGFGLFA